MQRHTGDAAAEAGRVGEELCYARQSLGLSLEEMAARLRIRRPYLEALEEGRLNDLPGPAYAVGFVRAYATGLGLDAGEMVRRFRDLSGAHGRQRPDLVFPEPVPERGVPAGAVVVVGAVVAICSYVAWYNVSGSANRTVDAVPPVPDRLEQAVEQGRNQLPGRQAARPAGPGSLPLAALPPPGGVVASPSGGGSANTSAQAATVPGNGTVPTQPDGQQAPGSTAPAPVVATVPPALVAPPEPPPPAIPGLPEGTRIGLRARMDSPDGAWVQVRDQRTGQVLVNRVLRPGEAWAVPLRDNLLLDTGKAQGLDIAVDGELVPVLEGQTGVRRNIPLAPDRLRAQAAASRAADSGG